MLILLLLAAPASADLASAHSSAPAVQPHPDSHFCPVCGLNADASCVCCAEQFCPRHTYLCPDCDSVFCADCLDLHLTDGHWSDSDTAAAFAQCNHGPRPTTAKLSNQPASVYAIHNESKTTYLAEPAYSNSRSRSNRDTSLNTSTTQHPAPYVIERPATPLKPNFASIVNFIHLLAHSLLPPGLPFAFAGSSSPEAGQ